MKRLLLTLPIVAAILGLYSCQVDNRSEWVDRTPIFRVINNYATEDGSLAIDGKAQEVSFKVLASEAWTATANDEMYRIQPSSGGSGTTNAVLSTPSNESGATKEVIIEFRSESGKLAQFTINQLEQQPFIEINPETISAAGDGEDITIKVETNQAEWTLDLEECGSWVSIKEKSSASVVLTVAPNETGKRRSADIRFYAVGAPELMAFLTISQNPPAAPPVADLLDVVFAADGTASDASAMKMAVDNSRRNSECAVVYNEKYKRYAAAFNNPTIARSGLTSGYYLIPYTETSDFAKKIADGYSYELLFCTYYDPTGLAQVKPFSSTQAGGTGMCFRANNGEINFETHVGGSWKELYSGIIPITRQYYHVIATWDKEAGVAKMYVDGKLAVSLNAVGDFKFMTTNVNKRWFGIGADPSASDTGEASFYGEVVIARLYDAPMSAEEVTALYKLVK